jgi:hypothetical protein
VTWNLSEFDFWSTVGCVAPRMAPVPHAASIV